jgi:hypothetical protein
VDDIVIHKKLKEFDKVECKTIDKVMLNKFDDCFPLGLMEILEVELPSQHFVEAPSHIRCRPFCMKHKNEIKMKFLTQHKTQWKMPMYACLASLINPKEIYPRRPTSWDEISNCMCFILGG